jgi:hypothetical protein
MVGRLSKKIATLERWPAVVFWLWVSPFKSSDVLHPQFIGVPPMLALIAFVRRVIL